MAEARVPLLIRIPAELKVKLAALAKRERRSLNQQIEFLLSQFVTSSPAEAEKESEKSH
jgi:hypothetical protein